MKFETKFPEGFPEIGDVIRFTCKPLTPSSSEHLTVEQITGREIWSTVEVLIMGRLFDAATGIHYLVTADDCYKNICNSGGWESQGWILFPQQISRHNFRFQEYRTKINELKIVRKHN